MLLTIESRKGRRRCSVEGGVLRGRGGTVKPEKASSARSLASPRSSCRISQGDGSAWRTIPSDSMVLFGQKRTCLCTRLDSTRVPLEEAYLSSFAVEKTSIRFQFERPTPHTLQIRCVAQPIIDRYTGVSSEFCGPETSPSRRRQGRTRKSVITRSTPGIICNLLQRS